ncbi:hypothetical protein ACN47E_003666 [Coniothyrium glycines]
MQLVALVGAPALLVSLGNAQLSLNSTSRAVGHNITLTTALDLNSFVPPSTSVPYLNATYTSNTTKNACQAEFESWTDGFWGWRPETTSITTFTNVYDLTLTSSEIFECTSTCNDICYAGPVTTSYSTRHISTVYTRTYGQKIPWTEPRPTCTIGFDDCISLQSSYSSATSSISALSPEELAYVQDPIAPACSACVTTACTFLGMFGMSLYYWPVTTSITRDYCATAPANGPATAHVPDKNNTYIPTTTGPYAVVDGITMYQGNVYLSYWEPRVQDNCGQEITRRSPGHNVLTVASSDVHSIRTFPPLFAPADWEWDLTPWPVNFDDFNPPTPYSAYSGQWKCDPNGFPADNCKIVKPANGDADGYHPYMIMPPQIRDLDENWKDCLYDKYAAFDPPIALHTRPNMFSSVEAKPTSITESRIVHTSPYPGQPGGIGIPIATRRPESPRPIESAIDEVEVRPSQPAQPQLPPGSKPTSTDSPSPGIPIGEPRPVVTIGPSVLPLGPSGGLVLRPGLTLTEGAAPTMVGNTLVSVGSSEIVLVGPQGTSIIALPTKASEYMHLITIGASILPINSAGALIINPGITLRQGDPPRIVDGTTISLGNAGIILVDLQRTQTLLLPDTIPSPDQLITVGSEVYTVRGDKLIMGPKLTLPMSGAVAVVAGTTISLGSQGVVIVSASKTLIVPLKNKISSTTEPSSATSKSKVLEAPKVVGIASPSSKVASGARRCRAYLQTFGLILLAVLLGLNLT